MSKGGFLFYTLLHKYSVELTGVITSLLFSFLLLTNDKILPEY